MPLGKGGGANSVGCFRPPCPPPPLPTGIFYPRLGSHGKIGDCEQSRSPIFILGHLEGKILWTMCKTTELEAVTAGVC